MFHRITNQYIFFYEIVFVNMNQLNKKTIEKINIFLEYVKAQEKHLSDIESLKSNFKKEYFNKQDKETNAYI